MTTDLKLGRIQVSADRQGKDRGCCFFLKGIVQAPLGMQTRDEAAGEEPRFGEECGR